MNIKNKFERIELLRELGLNTEENILINPEDEEEKYQDFLKKNDTVSLRTFDKNDSKGSPHFPHVYNCNAKDLILRLQSKGIFCILATPINPIDCKITGCVLKRGDSLIIEVAYGPYTVRRVTHEQKIDKTFQVINGETTSEELNKYLHVFKNCKLNNCIFEFSIYHHPVGYKKENLIIWEVTDDGTGKSKI